MVQCGHLGGLKHIKAALEILRPTQDLATRASLILNMQAGLESIEGVKAPSIKRQQETADKLVAIMMADRDIGNTYSSVASTIRSGPPRPWILEDRAQLDKRQWADWCANQGAAANAQQQVWSLGQLEQTGRIIQMRSEPLYTVYTF